MLDKMNEQLQSSMKPVTDLATLNAKALEQLATQQSSLFSTLMSGGIAFAQNSAEQKDVSAMLEAQKSYAQDVQETVLKAAKESYALISETQEKSGELIKKAMEEAQASVAQAAQAAK
ncbi:phasin family protein [Psychrobium sp. MM17-31]|uniref:phasin family protein n=1 Tax=Psychrobium sp. MM17-31 TaxID=2917758 RepID=UPI001EF4AA27|nr:phasin family protein [Psychrobium sp. MM17-31]MCG7530637.1 phasin family protein [Psychrobium sp. MM17-31]